MGIDFADDNKPKASAPITFFKVKDNFRPQQLHGEVIPELIHKVGDWKTGRVTQAGVEKYLDANILVFDRTVLSSMFEEADYLKEGSVGERELAASLSGRYPKRYLTNEWRMLAALILEIPQLVLTDDMIVPKVATKGSFNSECLWDSPPPALPPIKRKGSGSKSGSGTGASQAKPSSGTAAKLDAGPKPVALSAESLKSFDSGTDRGSMSKAAEAAVAAVAASDSEPPLGLPNLIYLKAKGYRTTEPTEEEMETYRNILKTSKDEQPSAKRSANIECSELKDCSSSGRIHEHEAISTSLLHGGDAGLCSTSASTLPGIPKQSLKAWNATLPPSCIHIPSGSLQTLRTTFRGTFSSKPEFINKTRPLTTTDMEKKTPLGQDMDLSKSLARVEPTRPTTFTNNVDYVTAGDYAPNCRTAPSNWDVHPAGPPEAKEPCKYPWGIRS